MAKIGKDNAEVDPFSAGNKAFGALDDALGALDDKPAADPKQSAPVPPPANGQARGPAAEKTPARPAAKKKASGRSKKKTASKATSNHASSGTKRARRFLATDEEMASWQRAAMRLGAATGARIDFSKMTRALWEIYLRHEEDIVRNLSDKEQWERPSNADAIGLAELDERLTDRVNEGLMLAGRLRRNQVDRDG